MSHDWMRSDKVDILKYLPSFLNKDKQFQAANDADSEEHDAVRILLQDLLDQCYVSTATWGLSLWEELVGLPTDTTKSYMMRRNSVLARLHSSYAVTLEFLNRLIDKYIINHSFKIKEAYDDYRIDIEVQDGKILSWDELLLALRIWMPAHIGWRFEACTEVNSSIHVGGAVTVFDEIHINASTGYNIGDIDKADIVPVGMVEVADVIHIGANVYE